MTIRLDIGHYLFIGDPLEQSLYLQTFSRYWPLRALGSRHWHFTKSLSPAIFEIMGIKHIWVTTLTFQGHVTSSVTWPFDSGWVISYWWSFGPKSLSLTVSVRWLVSANASEWLSCKSLYYSPIRSTLPWITPLSPNSLHPPLNHSKSLYSPQFTPLSLNSLHNGNGNFTPEMKISKQSDIFNSKESNYVLKVDSDAKVS